MLQWRQRLTWQAHQLLPPGHHGHLRTRMRLGQAHSTVCNNLGHRRVYKGRAQSQLAQQIREPSQQPRYSDGHHTHQHRLQRCPIWFAQCLRDSLQDFLNLALLQALVLHVCHHASLQYRHDLCSRHQDSMQVSFRLRLLDHVHRHLPLPHRPAHGVIAYLQRQRHLHQLHRKRTESHHWRREAQIASLLQLRGERLIERMHHSRGHHLQPPDRTISGINGKSQAHQAGKINLFQQSEISLVKRKVATITLRSPPTSQTRPESRRRMSQGMSMSVCLRQVTRATR